MEVPGDQVRAGAIAAAPCVVVVQERPRTAPRHLTHQSLHRYNAQWLPARAAAATRPAGGRTPDGVRPRRAESARADRQRAAPAPRVASAGAAGRDGDRYVDGAIGSPAPIGSTPSCARWSWMKPAITSRGGRAPPGQNSQTPCARSRRRVSTQHGPAPMASLADPAPPRLAGTPQRRRDRTDGRPLRRGLGTARVPFEPPVRAPQEKTCFVVPSGPSSQRMGPPTIRVRFRANTDFTDFTDLVFLFLTTQKKICVIGEIGVGFLESVYSLESVLALGICVFSGICVGSDRSCGSALARCDRLRLWLC